MDPIIKKTEERLEWLSSDAETRRRYEMRENSRIELNSLLYESKLQGEREGLLKVAKVMLLAGIAPETISSVTKLSSEELQKLAAEL